MHMQSIAIHGAVLCEEKVDNGIPRFDKVPGESHLILLRIQIRF